MVYENDYVFARGWVLHNKTQNVQEEKSINFLAFRRKVATECIRAYTRPRGVLETPMKISKSLQSAEASEL